jgi:hypothetical protein
VAVFFAGLVFGVLLNGEGFALTGVGHGSYAPLLIATPALLVGIFVGGIGFWVALGVGPFIWAGYFTWLMSLRRWYWRFACLRMKRAVGMPAL